MAFQANPCEIPEIGPHALQVEPGNDHSRRNCRPDDARAFAAFVTTAATATDRLPGLVLSGRQAAWRHIRNSRFH
jgi:hypothetical protein